MRTYQRLKPAVLIFELQSKERQCKIYHIKRKDIVSIIMPNTPEGIIAFYAINKIGAIANMISKDGKPYVMVNECFFDILFPRIKKIGKHPILKII